MGSNTLTMQVQAMADPKVAEQSRRFFKTGPGEYGEGDQFLGIRVPELRKLARNHHCLSDQEISTLLKSTYHEMRLTGLFILVYQFTRANEARRQHIFHFYLEHLDAVNNWDLVDTTAPQILGAYLLERPNVDRSFLFEYAKSKNLWRRRISILVTFAFLRVRQFEETVRLAKILLQDPHDLIHKAVGWMLREVGKREEKLLLDFLDLHAHEMLRTMLRYAIERLPEEWRQQYLKKK